MPCPSCRAQTAPGARFCALCGTALPAQARPARTTRRQMTVLFCDLVGSTELAERHDPDDLLDALSRYHALVRRVAARFGGYIARIVGDGVDIYFGYPVADEDDAVHAIHTALALADEVPRLSVVPGGEPLALRVGLATGLVAVSVGEGIALAGSTPNLAARIQSAVPPGCIGVAPGTRRIAGAAFEFEEFGEHLLKGFDTPVAIGLARGARSLDSRSAWRGRDARQPMVGRDAEHAALLAQWRRAADGLTCAALVLGEAGMGKSRLLTALQHALPEHGHTVLRLQGSPFHVNSALQPFVQHLAAAAGLARGDGPADQLDKLEAQLAIAGIDEPRECALIAALLGIPYEGRYPPLAMPPPMQLMLTKEALRHYFAGLAHGRAASADQRTLARYLVGMAEDRPLLLIVEDMHWIDPTSLEVLDLLLTGGQAAPILLLMSSRPGFASPWPDGERCLQLRLARLGDADAQAVAAQQARARGHAALPAAWLATVVERCDGVPLFIEEMARMLLDSSDTDRQNDPLRGVPDTLVDLLTARLDRLPGAGRHCAQVAAVIGREFDRALLGAVLRDEARAARLAPGVDGNVDVDPAGADDALLPGLAELLDSQLVQLLSADGLRLQFRHALVEDTAYAGLPPRRAAELHGRVAAALTGRFPERVQHQPELAAHHLSRAGQGLAASPWWLAAAGQALGRGAPREAAAHLRAGLQALQGTPAGAERDHAELGLLSMLGPTTMVLRGPGSAEFGAVQQRAYALSLSLPGQPRRFPITYSLCLYNWGRAELATAQALANDMLAAAALQPGDTETGMAAHNMAGMVSFHQGRAAVARAHLLESTALYEPGRDAALYPVYLKDFGVFGRFYLALSTQVLGHADAARRIAAEALTLAESLNQPHTLGFGMLANFNTAVMRGDVAAAQPMAERCLEFAGRFGFPEFIAMAQVTRGWCAAHGAGRWQDGLADILAGLDGWAATGFENWQPWFATLAAEVLLQLGRADEALALADHHLARIARNGERQFEGPLRAERAAAIARAGGGAAAAAFD
ncbi:MAG: hypothetical protein RLZZ584_3143, partial [Pseudomonadota bacterium]